MKIRKKQRNQTPGILYLAQVNLYSKKTISIICLNFYLIISFAYMSCQSFMESMQDGIKNTKERVGADLILVPKDYSSSIENALFQGYPCTVYFEPIWEEEAEQVGGVEKVTTQVFLATLNAECCDNAVQLVGFDATTDYIIGPWLEQALGHTLRENQIVVGASLQQEKGDKVKYYGTEFESTARIHFFGIDSSRTWVSDR